MRWLSLIAMLPLVAVAGQPAAPPVPGVTPVLPVATDADGEPVTRMKLALAFPKLKFNRPIWLTYPPKDKQRLFVVEQDGIVHVFPHRSEIEATQQFLDIKKLTTRVDNEEGLLALAFDPKYDKNGHFYVWYSAVNPRRHVLARFTVSKDDPNKAGVESQKVLMEIEKPFGNHNGATLIFGKDNYLYISTGDGGAGGDPHNNGQNLGSLLGKILRIDVRKEEAGRPYAIPKDNPFVSREGAKPEIYAWGLRNVWRMSFDRETGELWAGDVGQNLYEEVHVIQRGGNYGWRIREGFHLFKDEPASAELLDPIAEYGRTLGASITGGYVYRGKRLPYLRGMYVCADYVTGTVLALHRPKRGQPTWEVIVKQPHNIASFGEDAAGEMYLLAFDGRIYQLAEIQPAVNTHK